MNETLQQPDDRCGDVTRERRFALLRGVCTLVCAVATLAPLRAIGQEAEFLLPEKECQVKYALLYSFGLLTTWPAEAFDPPDGGPFVIGVFGTKPFPEYLTRISETKKIQGRKIIIRRFQTSEEVGHCHILYVTNSAPSDAEKAVARKLAQQPVLLVSERALESGTGMIEFVIEHGAVKFLLNAEVAKVHRLQIDPRLLKLAKRPSSPPSPKSSAP
jgi:hypothetical protein